MSIQFTPDTSATRRAFNRLAREKMKLRLLADIRMDLMVCELVKYNVWSAITTTIIGATVLYYGKFWDCLLDKM